MIPLFYLFGICWLIVATFNPMAFIPATMCFIAAGVSHWEYMRTPRHNDKAAPSSNNSRLSPRPDR